MPIPNNQNGDETTHPIKAIVLLAILAFGSVQLKINGFIGDPALVSLLALSLLSGFIVYLQARIKKAGPAGIELHKAIQEVRESEATVKELAAAIVEVIAADATGAIRHDQWDSERFGKALDNLKRLSE